MLEILTQEIDPETLGGFAEVFERYGFGTICCVVIVLGIFWFVKQNTKTQDRLWDKLDELSSKSQQPTQQSSGIGLNKDELKDFIVDIVREETSKILKTEKTQNVDVLKTYSKISKTIQPMMIKAKDDFDADRISMFVFHNGTHSSHGLPFYKYTCIQEVLNREKLAPSRIAEQQGAPLSILDNMTLTQLAESDGFIIDVSMDYIFPMATARLKRDGFKSSVAITIKAGDDEVIGFIYMGFSDERSKDELNDIMIRMSERASSVASILDFNKNRDEILGD